MSDDLDFGDDCQKEHFVGEVGTQFFVDCKVDVSTATLIEVFLSRPDGTTIKKTATATVFNGSTNFAVFTIAIGDFNQEGEYSGQIFLTLGSWTGWGKAFEIEIGLPISSSSSSSSSQSSSSSSRSSSCSSSSSAT